MVSRFKGIGFLVFGGQIQIFFKLNERGKSMSESFKGKVAVVTGAGEGIGFEIAKQLALRGASVVLNDLNADLAASAADAIQSEGGRCEGVAGDVAEISVVQTLVSEASSRFGRLDIAISNAGLTSWGDFFSYTPEAFQRVVSVNLQGSFFLAQAAAKLMREQGEGGKILFTSSVTGHRAVPFLAAYGMTKAGLEMLAKSLVLELSPLKITVNAVAPGAIVTPRNLKDDPNYESTWGNLIPLKRAGQASDIASAAVFLVSDEAGFITGQTLVVDGGWTSVGQLPSQDSFDFVEKND